MNMTKWHVVDDKSGTIIGTYKLQREALAVAGNYNEIARTYGLGWVCSIARAKENAR